MQWITRIKKDYCVVTGTVVKLKDWIGGMGRANKKEFVRVDIHTCACESCARI